MEAHKKLKVQLFNLIGDGEKDPYVVITHTEAQYWGKPKFDNLWTTRNKEMVVQENYTEVVKRRLHFCLKYHGIGPDGAVMTDKQRIQKLKEGFPDTFATLSDEAPAKEAFKEALLL